MGGAPGAPGGAGASERSSKYTGGPGKGTFDAPTPPPGNGTISKAPTSSSSTPPPAPKPTITSTGTPSTQPSTIPPMTPGGTPGASGGAGVSEKSSKYTGGPGKGTFDAPPPKAGDGTISKAPASSPSTSTIVTPPVVSQSNSSQPPAPKKSSGTPQPPSAPKPKSSFKNPFASSSKSNAGNSMEMQPVNTNTDQNPNPNPDQNPNPNQGQDQNPDQNQNPNPNPNQENLPAPTKVLPSQNLPDFFQTGQALGAIAVTNVNGAPAVTTAVTNLLPNNPNATPVGVDQIESALTNDFESFLGKGRNFPLRVGNKWFEANVQAHLDTPPSDADAISRPTTKTKVDFTANSGATANTTTSVATSGELAFSATAGRGAGPYVTVGGKVPLARPAASTSVQTSTVDQRAIRSGENSTIAKIPVTYTVTLTDANNQPVGTPTTVTSQPGADVDTTVQIPNELVSPTPHVPIKPAVAPSADWGAKVEHVAPEAVTDVDNDVFDKVAGKLHPSVTKLGAPGRTALQDFLSPTTIRDNLGTMLNGWVTSPELASPNSSYAGAVQMKATLTDVELLGTNPGAQLRLHDIANTSTGVSTNTKSGFDVTVGVGGGVQVSGKLGGTGGVVGGFSSRITETSNVGTNTGNRSGIQVKSDTGLYKVGVQLEVRTSNGASVPVSATTYMRIGLPEAAAQGLPTPDDGPTTLTKPGTADTKFEAPYLTSELAAGNVKVGEFAPASQVQAEVEAALRKLPGFEKFLPGWGDPKTNPTANPATNTTANPATNPATNTTANPVTNPAADATVNPAANAATNPTAAPKADPPKGGKNFADLVEQLNNQRKLNTELSPTALKAKMDSLLGPGVNVQLKRQGLATNDFVNIKVTAELSNVKHLGQVDAHNVRNWGGSGPKLDSSTTVQKGGNIGLEAKVSVPTTPGSTDLTPTPSAGVKYSDTTSVKTTAGPAVNSSGLNVGASNAQVFEHDVTIKVEITEFSRNRAWVKRITPGLPGAQPPKPQVVAKTGGDGPKVVDIGEINGKVKLWASDSSTFDTDQQANKPGTPVPTPLATKTDIKQMLTGPRPPAPEILHVEAVANTEAVKQAAITALTNAANGDSALTVPGTAARNQIDKLFSPEAMKANLTKMAETGVQEGGLKYGRRYQDRIGAIGAKVELSGAKLVSVSDKTGTETTTSGGFKASDSTVDTKAVEFAAGLNLPAKPTASPTGQGAVGVNAKWTPWSKSSSTGAEVGGNVDRVKIVPASGRTVLVQMDAKVTVVAESRAGNTVSKGRTDTDGIEVDLPGGVFVRVSEDVARDLGVLDPEPDQAGGANPEQNTPEPNPDQATTGNPDDITVDADNTTDNANDFGELAPPKSLRPGRPGSLGLGMIEKLPHDLPKLVDDLAADLKKNGTDLIPPSVLDDSMNNFQRLVDLTSPTSVKALMDSALDGGVPLLVHKPGTFGKDTYQVTLKAVTGDPKFTGMANDGVDVEHIIAGSTKTTVGQGKGTAWGVGLKVPGAGLPSSTLPNQSGSAGASVAVNHSQARNSAVTDATTTQVGHKRVAGGPVAKFDVPVTFELVVEKGNQSVGTAKTPTLDMGVRLHADNQKIAVEPPTPNTTANDGTAPNPTTTPVSPPLPPSATPNADAKAWQTDGAAKPLPPSASVETLRGAKDLRAAAVEALQKAGAKPGLTDKGTGSLNSLYSALSSENLQPQLPGMLTGPLTVPGMHEAALTFSQHADVKVYAKMVNPTLAGLSDGVKLENPRTTVKTTSSEAKKTEINDVVVGGPTGGLTTKANEGALFSSPGLEFKHAGEVSDAQVGGASNNKINDLKREGRTGLVEFDVEYRIVADLGKGRTGVVELTVPGSAQVRMPALEAQTLLDKQLADLDPFQDAVKKAGADWRAAEVAVEKAQHAVDDLELKIKAGSTAIKGAEAAVNDARTKYDAEAAKLPPLETAAGKAETDLDTAHEVRDTRGGELDAAGNNLETANTALADAKAEIGEKTAALAELNIEIDTAAKDVKTADGAVKAAEQALTDHQTNRPAPPEGQAPAPDPVETDLADQVVDAKADLAAKQEALQDLQDKSTAANQELDGRKAGLPALEQQVKDADAALKEAQKLFEAAEKDVQAKNDAAEAANKKLDDAKEIADAAEAKLDEAQDKLDAARDAKDALVQQRPGLKETLENRRNDVPPQQQKWWDAKKALDQQLDAFNSPPPDEQAQNTPEGQDPQNQQPVQQNAEASSSKTAQPTPPTAPPTGTPTSRSIPSTPATPTPSSAPDPRRGPTPEKSFDFAPGTDTLTDTQAADLQTLATDLAEANAKRDRLGYLPPTVEVSGANARTIANTLADQGIDAKVTPGRDNGADVKVDWDLKRPADYVPPAAPVGTKVTDTVITSPAPQGPHPILDDLGWKHSTAANAPWFDVDNPASAQDIADVRANTPVTSTVRGEDGGVLSNSTITADGVNLEAWRGPIAYDVRNLDVNGAKVTDFTVRLHLDPKGNANPQQITDLEERAKAGVDAFFNQGNKLPTGAQFNVTVEFTDNAADAHSTIEIGDPDGRANQLTWPVDTDPRRLAHEVGHFLGLHDEYFETDDVKPIFQHKDGQGRVVDDNGPMTDGIDADDAALKPRNLVLIENRLNALESVAPQPTLSTVDTTVQPPNAPSFFKRTPPPATPAPPLPVTGPLPPVLPNTPMPAFFQSNQALGTIATNGVQGVDQVTGTITTLLPTVDGVTPEGVDHIGRELDANFESFLGNGRTFQIKIGKDWFDANVKAVLNPVTGNGTASPAKVDSRVDSGTTTSTTTNLSTGNDLSLTATAGQGVGAYGTLGVKTTLSTPVTTSTTTSSTVDDREVRGGDPSTKYDVPVSYTISLTNAQDVTIANTVVQGDAANPTTVALQVPDDLRNLANTDNDFGTKPVDDVTWSAEVEHLVPEAITDLDADQAFKDVAANLHPSVVKPGADGRTVLRDFLSATNIRDNLHVMLNGWVTSPNLTSPNASYGAAVQMKATLVGAELVGTHGGAQFRMHDTATTTTGVTASTSAGVEVNAAVGGGVGTPGVHIGSGGITGSVSAKTTESSSAGATAVNRAGIQVGGQTGMYKVTVNIDVRTPNGPPVTVPATGYVRLGLPEAAAHRLPVPPGTQAGITKPGTADTRFEPPYLAAGLAAGNIRVGEFTTTDTDVRSEVETALKGLDGFAGFLPTWNRDTDPRADGKNFADVAEQLANQRKLDAELSPTALKSTMDSLLGPGVQVQLKRQGVTTNDFVNVTVKAKLSAPKHLGEADARNVRGLNSAAPKLDSATTTAKGWSVGVEARGGANVKPGGASLAPTATAAVKQSSTTSTKTTAGPTVNDVALNVGDAKAQVFAHDVEFEIEITEFSRNRSWVKRITPGSPFLKVPDGRTVVRTPDPARPVDPTARNNPKIIDKVQGKVHLWVPDGSALKTNPADLAPKPPVVTPLPADTTITSLLKPGETRPPRDEWLHVEAVANADALRDNAIKLLDAAAGPDTSLTVPGTVARNQIDKMFSPENLKANLRRMAETGVVEDSLRFDRRVTDRTGALGMSVTFGNAKLVSISDTTPTEVWTGGGFKAGESTAKSKSGEGTVGVAFGGKPGDTTPQGGGTFNASAKWTPWSRTETTAKEVGGNVDRKLVRPPGERTVLVQLDADFKIVGESRAGNAVHAGTTQAKAATVTLPGGVFVRVSEQVARDMDLLPDVPPHDPPEFGDMRGPKRLAPNQPSSLGLSLVDDVPDMSKVVSDLTAAVNQQTQGRIGSGLIPDSVLDDSMRNLRRLVDFTSPTSVKGLIDSALDGGVPLLLHKPGTVIGKDTYQVTLKAKTDAPKFLEAVNDGYDIEHITAGTKKDSDGLTKGTSWGLNAKAAGLHLPDVRNGMSPSVGGAVGAGLGWSQSKTTTDTTTEQSGHKHTATGPAVRYQVPVAFELVVHKGDQEIGRATSDQAPMTVRLHADNVRVDAPTVPDSSRPYGAEATSRPDSQRNPANMAAWQQAGTPVTPPPGSSVEGMRGAQDIRLAAIAALEKAGAGKGITGRGTGSLNALLATLSSETLQSTLPGMTAGPLDVPGLHESTLLKAQHANLKVYAKLVNPKLDSLSDGVKLENPSATTHATTSEVKHAQSGDVTVGVPAGGLGKKTEDAQGNPDLPKSVNFSGTGVEFKHSGEDATTDAGGPTGGTAQNLKPAGRTGLVEFDVEYRFVAEVGGRVGVYDLTVPGSADLRMPLADVEAVLGRPIDPGLAAAQNAVRDTAKTWRTAQAAVDATRHRTQDLLTERVEADTAAANLRTVLDNRLATVETTFEVVGERDTAVNTARDERDTANSAVEDLETTAGALDRASRRADIALRDADERVRFEGETVQALELRAESVDNLLGEAEKSLHAATTALADFNATNPPPGDPTRTGLADGVEAATGTRDGWRTEQAKVADELAEAREKHDAAVEQQTIAAQNVRETTNAVVRAKTDLETAERTAEAAQWKLDEAAQQARAARDVARKADQARIEAERAHQQAERKVAELDVEITAAQAELAQRRAAADAEQARWWAAKTAADRQVGTFNTPPPPTPPSPTPSPSPTVTPAPTLTVTPPPTLTVTPPPSLTVTPAPTLTVTPAEASTSKAFKAPTTISSQTFGGPTATLTRGFGAPVDGTAAIATPARTPDSAPSPAERKAQRDKAVADLAAKQAAERTAESNAVAARQAAEKRQASNDLTTKQQAEYHTASTALAAKLDAERLQAEADLAAKQQADRTTAGNELADRLRAEHQRVTQELAENQLARQQQVVSQVVRNQELEQQQYAAQLRAHLAQAPGSFDPNQLWQRLLTNQENTRQNVEQQIIGQQKVERQNIEQQLNTRLEQERRQAELRFDHHQLAERHQAARQLKARQDLERQKAEQDLKARQQLEREQVEKQLDAHKLAERELIEQRLNARQDAEHQAELRKWLPADTKHFDAFADDAAAGKWADDNYPGLAQVNRARFAASAPGHDVNCTNCVIATHETLHGRPVAAPPLPAPAQGSYLENHFGTTFRPAANYHEVVDHLTAKPGAHVSVGITRSDGTGHVFNGWHDGQNVTFYDSQNNRPARLERDAVRIQFIPLPDLPTTRPPLTAQPLTTTQPPTTSWPAESNQPVPTASSAQPPPSTVP
ncbi:toxin glutamine deamidase domain-containing protein [Actinosynnema sp. CS-041913]|uniref:toxin glutamine deamidase domain-containing protein n=1 Tax=Actinosynnema sp. CS-041913 TaxID=3239917 RepID=UPI003D8EA4E5